jgi:hypothetical protein
VLLCCLVLVKAYIVSFISSREARLYIVDDGELLDTFAPGPRSPRPGHSVGGVC